MEVLWNYDNVTSEKENNYISTFDGKDWKRLTFTDRYYTFNALVKELKKQNITLTYDPNSLLSTVETKSALRLRRLEMLLGFDIGMEISAKSSATSTNMININDGLQVISVLCDKINDSKNFFNGKRTQVLWSFCTPSNRSSKGGTSKYNKL